MMTDKQKKRFNLHLGDNNNIGMSVWGTVRADHPPLVLMLTCPAVLSVVDGGQTGALAGRSAGSYPSNSETLGLLADLPAS